MKLVWTRNKLPLSWLIRAGLSEPVSHFAIVFDEKLVFQSNLMGTGICWFRNFKEKHEIVYSIDVCLPLIEEEMVYQDILLAKTGSLYDFKAFAYFIWRGFLRRFFAIPLPEKNKANDDNSFLCTELAKAIEPLIRRKFKDSELAMTSPYQLYLICKRAFE